MDKNAKFLQIKEETAVTFILLKEIDGFVVQGLERDIAAQGKTADEAHRKFGDTYARELALGSAHFLNIPPAPEYYQELSRHGIGLGIVHDHLPEAWRCRSKLEEAE